MVKLIGTDCMVTQGQSQNQNQEAIIPTKKVTANVVPAASKETIYTRPNPPDMASVLTGRLCQ